jgi:hypothetical protein
LVFARSLEAERVIDCRRCGNSGAIPPAGGSGKSASYNGHDPRHLQFVKPKRVGYAPAKAGCDRAGDREAVETVVQGVTMLVTADGNWVFEDSPEFLAALGDPDPDYDATQFAVKNFGFIKFEMLGKSVIEITLHPHNVALPALLAVQEQIQSSRITLFRIKYFDTDWRSEIFPAAERVIERLSELCAPVFVPPRSDKFIATPKDYSSLFGADTHPLRLLAQKWKVSFGYFNPSVISFAINHGLLSRLIIVGVQPHKTEPVFRFIGDGHANWLDRDYHFQSIGEKVENQPDKEYGSWVSNFYKAVASTREPRYDHVTAEIQRPPGKYTTSYERLLLPWKTPSAEVLVTLLSKPVRWKGLKPDLDAGWVAEMSDRSVTRKLAKSS